MMEEEQKKESESLKVKSLLSPEEIVEFKSQFQRFRLLSLITLLLLN
jgi:hypothetical protein